MMKENSWYQFCFFIQKTVLKSICYGLVVHSCKVYVTVDTLLIISIILAPFPITPYYKAYRRSSIKPRMFQGPVPIKPSLWNNA